MRNLFINASLAERMLGRKIDWGRTDWTAAERGISDTVTVPLPANSNDPTTHHVTIRLGNSTTTSTASDGGNDGPVEIHKNRKQRRAEAAEQRRQLAKRQLLKSGGSANRNVKS